MRIFNYIFVSLMLLYASAAYSQQPFTAGNIVVYRVGDGVTTMNSLATTIFLDEYTPAGTLVQSIPMPVTGNRVTMNTLNTAGLITLSANGKYLLVPGLDVAVGTDINSAPPPGSIAVVDFNGAVNSVTVLPNPSFDVPRSVASDDGINLWWTAAAVHYTTVASSTVTNIYQPTGPVLSAISIVDGQLYITNTSGTPEIAKLGTGLPVTTGQSLTTLPGFANTDYDAAGQFAFADMDPNVPGMDVLYLASQATAGGGIQKFSLVNNSWILNGTIGTAAERYRGLAIRVSLNTVTIFSTRRGSNSLSIRGGALVKLTDNSGYNGALTGTPVIMASASPANTKGFRGVALVPLGCPSVATPQAINVTASQGTVTWTAPTGGSGNYEYVITTSQIPPASGTATSTTSATATGLSNNTTYYAHVRSVCGPGSFSEWSSTFFVTSCKAPAVPQINVTVSPTGNAIAKWRQVFGAAAYQYQLLMSSTPGATGIAVNDTSVNLGQLSSTAQYYLFVRSDCGGGEYSTWTMVPFSTGCFAPSPVITLLPKNAGIKWNNVGNALKYEYSLTYNSAHPYSGSYTIDTVYTRDDLDAGTGYYFHVRTVCRNGSVSDWTTAYFAAEGLNVYPNPANDVLNIRVNGSGNALSTVVITDAMGRVVVQTRLTNSTATIDTRKWSQGVYMIRYNNGKTTYTVKVLKP